MKNRFRNRLRDRVIPAGPEAQKMGILGIRLEYDYGDDPRQLATRIGELYQDQMTFESEATSYAQQAISERQKAAELRHILEQIEGDPSRQSLVAINPKTGLPRRMNPYQEYSVDAILEQALVTETRAVEFDETAQEKRQSLGDARAELNDVQRALDRLKDK